MADNDAKERGKTSTADIAATLLNPAKPGDEDDNLDGDQVDKNASDADEDDDFDTQDDQSPGGGDDDKDVVETDDDLDEDDDESGDEDTDDDEADDEIDYLDIDDDDIINVTVDDEEQEVSIRDLKRAYSGEGAIEKRLQEATEIRKEAHARTTQTLENLAAQERELQQALEGLDDNLFKGIIPPPDDRMRQTDPERYMRHKDAYDQDQQRIADAKKVIEDKKGEISQQRQQRLDEYAKEAGAVIAREIPELVDPKTSQQAFTQMAQTAMTYGYTQEEINKALDPRMFMLVRDAMRYHQMVDKAKERDPKDLKGQQKKRVRRLRSGNTQAKNRVSQADKKRKQATEKARKTGKPSDIAATLLVNNKR